MVFIDFIKLPKRFMAYKILRMPAFGVSIFVAHYITLKTEGNGIHWSKILLLKWAEYISHYLGLSTIMKCCFSYVRILIL